VVVDMLADLSGNCGLSSGLPRSGGAAVRWLVYGCVIGVSQDWSVTAAETARPSLRPAHDLIEPKRTGSHCGGDRIPSLLREFRGGSVDDT
jgi:hypothetical protein